MTPLEHYREAERLLRRAAEVAYGKQSTTRPPNEVVAEAVAVAQVHATLANAHMTAGVWEEKR